MFICQVAFSVADVQQSLDFYQNVFGFQFSGQTHMAGEMTEKIQGLPGAESDCAWLVDGREFFQLEFFQFKHPEPKPFARNRRPYDIGYSRIQIKTVDLQAVIEKLSAYGIKPITPVEKINGSPRCCFYDINHVLVEVVEAGINELADGRFSILSGLAMSVPDLNRSRDFFIRIMEAGEISANSQEIDRLCGISDVKKNVFSVDGGACFLEVSEYQTPEPKPWPDGYQICDYGILNIAFGFNSQEDFDHYYQKSIDAGYRFNANPMKTKRAAVTYMFDDQGFSMEYLYLAPSVYDKVGFIGKGADLLTHSSKKVDPQEDF